MERVSRLRYMCYRVRHAQFPVVFLLLAAAGVDGAVPSRGDERGAPTCDGVQVDTIRSTLSLAARFGRREVPLERQQLLLQEVIAVLPPPRSLPVGLRLDLDSLRFDEATVRSRMVPSAGVRFQLRADGRVQDLELVPQPGSWFDLELDSLLVRTVRTLGDQRALAATLFRLDLQSARVELRLTTAPQPDEVSIPILRLATPFTKVDVPASLRQGNPAPIYPYIARETGKGDTVTFRVVVTEGGYVDRSRSVLTRASWRDFVTVVEEVLPYLRFRPARANGCAVRSIRDVTFEFRSGKVFADEQLDPARVAMQGPPIYGISPAHAVALRADSGRARFASRPGCGAGRTGTDTTYGTMYASLQAIAPASDGVRATLPSLTDGIVPMLRRPKAFGFIPDSLGHGKRAIRLAAYMSGAVGFTLDRDGNVLGFRYVRDHLPLRGMVQAVLDAEARGVFREALRGTAFDSLVLALVMSSEVPANESSVEVFTFMFPPQPFYFDFQVERPALVREGNPAPRYPAHMMMEERNGDVLVQFVIDATGAADMQTLRVLRSNHESFTKAVRDVLPRYRFYPAEHQGCPVRMFVQMPFTFRMGSNFGERVPSNPIPPIDLPGRP